MSDVFLAIALLLSAIAALLYFAGERKLLNFVDYGQAETAARINPRINRYAALRLLVPVFVSLGCAYASAMRPDLTVPLLFLIPVSILVAVVWIAAGINRLKLHSP